MTLEQQNSTGYEIYPDARPHTDEFLTLDYSADMFHMHQAEAPQDNPDWTETVYLGFCIPEERISGQIYSWLHPFQRQASGGVFIYQGFNPIWLQAEHYDYRMVLPYPETDLDDIDFGNGLTLQVREPLQQIDVQYRSTDGSVTLDLRYDAIMPAAGRLDGKHLAQTMRTTGTLRLRDKTYEVNSFFTRDRSWNQVRSEKPQPIPPLTWGAATFGEDLSFHFVGFDAYHRAPEWADDFDSGSLPDSLRWGWVWTEGELRGLNRMEKRTIRGADGIAPDRAEVELTDTRGTVYSLTGRSIAHIVHPAFPNLLVEWALMEYDLDGRTGYGDYQDCMFTDHVRRHAVRPPRL
ncbi:DUF7064 domain-containing protein [Nocardia brevicatena]|uniref:DUF7064 domain-containing protein n=1 Tax=Nocardia brevicatena TaxID=37327 RepID=UPI0002D6D136|nr:hypothetical protein [Nocardia brevicatena]